MNLVVDGNSVYAYTGSRAFDRAQPTVLFVHGAANDHGVFALQSRYFAWHGRNVLALDLPAHGRSRGEALPSVEALAQWLRNVIDAAEIDKVSVAGHSLGSLAALEFASQNPDRVRALALLGPAVPMTVSDELLAAAARNDHVAYELINGWSFSAGGQLGGNELPGVWMTGNALRLLERCPKGVLSIDLLACHQYQGGLAAAAAVRCPTLAILAARDVMAPLSNASALVGALANIKTVTLAETGHSMMAERPGKVLDALRPFL